MCTLLQTKSLFCLICSQPCRQRLNLQSGYRENCKSQVKGSLIHTNQGKALIKSLQFCTFNLTAVQCFLQVVNHSSTSLDIRNESSRAYFTQSKGIVSLERSFFQRQGPSFLAGAVCLTYVFRILSTLLCIILSCPVYYNTGITSP